MEDGKAREQYRCRCHKVAGHKRRKLREMLLRLGFEEVPDEDRRHVFCMRRRLPGHGQLYIKVMSNGRIEAEIEPLPECPPARITQEHSYSAHRAVADVLGECGIKPRTAHDAPSTCLDPPAVRPSKPTRWKVLVAIVAAIRRLLAHWR